MGMVYGVLSYVGLFVYMPFYYTVVASLSVRTMIMLHERPHGRMLVADLRDEFVSRGLVSQRLATMVANGLSFARWRYALSKRDELPR